LKNENSTFANDWKHKLVLKPIPDSKSEKEEEDSDSEWESESESESDDSEEYEEIEESTIEINECDRCYVIYGFNPDYGKKFEPPNQVFYTMEDAEKEFLTYYTSSILSISEEYINIGRTIKSMIEVKESETVITMYEYHKYTGGYYDFPDRGYRYVLKILLKGRDY
jgi:hypothetical protein